VRFSAGAAINQEAELLDPGSLFLPLKAAANPPPPASQLADDFPPFPPRLAFDAAELGRGVHLPPPVAVPKNAADTLEVDPAVLPVQGIGRKWDNLAPLPARAAAVEVFDLRAGRRVFAGTLAPDTPGLAVLAQHDWHAGQFLASVDAAGLIAPLTPVPGSPAASDPLFPPLDEKELGALENAVAKLLGFGSKLAPGTYRVSVGP
jgi:hypothetical protein